MKRAFCFDLDGTLTKQEILPAIAKGIGLAAEISALTDATIKGVIPFESSFRLRCRLLSEVSVSTVRNIVDDIPLFEHLVEFIRVRSECCYVITGNLDIWVGGLLERIGVSAWTSRAEARDDRLHRVTHVLDKGQAAEAIRRSHNEIIAIGDGMGDLSMFANADLRIAFAGLHSPVVELVESADLICSSEKALLQVLEGLP